MYASMMPPGPPGITSQAAGQGTSRLWLQGWSGGAGGDVPGL